MDHHKNIANIYIFLFARLLRDLILFLAWLINKQPASEQRTNQKTGLVKTRSNVPAYHYNLTQTPKDIS